MTLMPKASMLQAPEPEKWNTFDRYVVTKAGFR